MAIAEDSSLLVTSVVGDRSLEAQRELKFDIRKTAAVPVIFLSMYGQDETVDSALDMGAVDYLVKPFSPTELSASIRAALSGSGWNPSRTSRRDPTRS